MTRAAADRHVLAVRRFNRFYTRQIGLLRDGYLDSGRPLAEVRVLYELAHRDRLTATDLGRELGLDAGYLSRLLRGFETRGLIARARSKDDGRQSLLTLTRQGRKVFEPLQERSHREIGAMLAHLSPADQKRLGEALSTVEELLGGPREARAPYVLRPPRPGDLGWVVSRHGALYAAEYGFDETFEALVAEIAGKFIRDLDPKRERAWIAEKDGENVGSVLVVRKSAAVAKLRLLLVEPSARGLGIGARLVDECIRFARQVGYRKMTLWTQSVLVAARHIYAAAGFRMVREEKQASFGRDLVSETWELTL